jgi:hypothetical protein
MFFSPLVKKDLQEETNIQDKKFINLYIKYWNINLIILAIIIISWTISYFIESNSIYFIYQISLRVLTWSVIIGTLLIIRNLLNNKMQLSWKI